MSDIENIADELQKQIMAEVKKRYSPKVIQSWQHPQNWGIMHDADGYGKVTGPCGDTMEISITVTQGTIRRCTFDTDGCGASIACGSIITEMATGKTIDHARTIDQERVLKFCGGLPDESKHCALLAARTLKNAIRDYEKNKQSPWRKYYEKH
jgi:nitrogen fixation NifU-like protein